MSTLAALRDLRAQLADSRDCADGVAALDSLLSAVEAREAARARLEEATQALLTSRLSTLCPLDIVSYQHHELDEYHCAQRDMADAEYSLRAILGGKS